MTTSFSRVLRERFEARIVRRMRFSTIILAAFALLLAGGVATDLRVTNRTGTGIHIYSGHTKKVTTIAAGATATVPHTSGRIIVITERGDVWEYDNVRTLADEVTRGYKRLSLHVSIESEGSITLPSDKKLTPARRLMR